MGNVVFHPKQPSILKWSKRFELWLCYGLLLNIAAFGWLWSIGPRIHDPLVRMRLCAFVGGGYLILALLFWRIWDDNGNRRYNNPVARLWWGFVRRFEWYET
jgi:hypothetical protein